MSREEGLLRRIEEAEALAARRVERERVRELEGGRSALLDCAVLVRTLEQTLGRERGAVLDVLGFGPELREAVEAELQRQAISDATPAGSA